MKLFWVSDFFLLYTTQSQASPAGLLPKSFDFFMVQSCIYFLLQIRSYSVDIEKLQKDVEVLQQQNQKLQQELHMANEQILTHENSENEVCFKNINF